MYFMHSLPESWYPFAHNPLRNLDRAIWRLSKSLSPAQAALISNMWQKKVTFLTLSGKNAHTLKNRCASETWGRTVALWDLPLMFAFGLTSSTTLRSSPAAAEYALLPPCRWAAHGLGCACPKTAEQRTQRVIMTRTGDSSDNSGQDHLILNWCILKTSRVHAYCMLPFGGANKLRSTKQMYRMCLLDQLVSQSCKAVGRQDLLYLLQLFMIKEIRGHF